MSKRSRYSANEKYSIIQEHNSGTLSASDISHMYGVVGTTLRHWIYLYKKYGVLGLKESKTWKNYSEELRTNAVLEYLTGNYSLLDIVKKYEISGKSVLSKWIKKYNSHSELNDTSKGKVKSMTKENITMWKEKIKIAENCISHDKAYQLTADKYDVSYQQVYQWVQKYEKNGAEALKDGRGRKKSIEELTPEEKFDLKLKKLEAENEKLRAENALLKKLEKLERGW